MIHRLTGCLIAASCVAAFVPVKADIGPLGCRLNGAITIAAVGDIIFQLPAARSHQFSYRKSWRSLENIIAGADLAYANVEGPIAVAATHRTEMSSQPRLNFNYRPSIIEDLKASGFDVISTANNHALDQGSLGVEQTIANLEKGKLAFTGTRNRSARTPWSTLTHAGGLTVAWLACTYGTNGIPDLHSQVLLCFQQQDEVVAEIARLSADASIDAVIFTPHWGIENSRVIERRQRELARAAVDAGALVVLGTHPHVLQRWQRLTARDGHQALVIYSTGNFISAQREAEQRTGIIAILSLVKSGNAHKARLSAGGYILTQIIHTLHGFRVVEAGDAIVADQLPRGSRLSGGDLLRTCDSAVLP